MGGKPRSLSAQLRQAMTESGLTVYGVAKGSGVSPPVVYRFVTGESGISLTNAEKIAAFLKLRLARFEPKQRVTKLRPFEPSAPPAT